jgi:hypothetical protein
VGGCSTGREHIDSASWHGATSSCRSGRLACWRPAWRTAGSASGTQPRLSLQPRSKYYKVSYAALLTRVMQRFDVQDRTAHGTRPWFGLQRDPVPRLGYRCHQRRSEASHAATLDILTRAQIWVWDLNTPQKPYSPGTRSRNLRDISSLAWNKQVAHILATSSTSGYTVVWDLRNKREVVALNFAAATGQQPGGPATWMNGQQGARRGISAVSWHPDNVRAVLDLAATSSHSSSHSPPRLLQPPKTI